MAKVAGWRPDVLITRWTPGISDALRGLRIPTVLIGGYEAHPQTICVGVDNEKVGELAAQHLLDRALRNFAFVGKAYPFVRLRERGFVRVLKRAGHDCATQIEAGQWDHYLEDWPHADDSLATWLKMLPKPVGVFGAQDTTGWQVLQICHGARLRVPDDIAVVAANGSGAAPKRAARAARAPRQKRYRDYVREKRRR